MQDPSLRDKVIILETRLNMIETSVNNKLNDITSDMKSVRNDVADMKNMIAMGRGGWKVVALLGSLILGAIAVLKFLILRNDFPS